MLSGVDEDAQGDAGGGGAKIDVVGPPPGPRHVLMATPRFTGRVEGVSVVIRPPETLRHEIPRLSPSDKQASVRKEAMAAAEQVPAQVEAFW